MAPAYRYKVLSVQGPAETAIARLKDLEEQVNSHIEDGWQPIGGIGWVGTVPTQAMTHPGYTITISSGGENA